MRAPARSEPSKRAGVSSLYYIAVLDCALKVEGTNDGF